MQNALAGKRVLITQSSEFMGPVLCRVFEEQGAAVVASTADLVPPAAAEAVVRAPGPIDVLWRISRWLHLRRRRSTSTTTSGGTSSRRWSTLSRYSL